MIRDATFSDFDEIRSVVKRNGLSFNKSYREWKSQWIDNPAYQGKECSWPIGWVMQLEDGRVVGYCGNIPMAYKFKGKEICAAVFQAWVVDREYRSKDHGLLKKYFSQSHVDIFLSTSTIKKAGRAFRQLGAKKVPSIDYDKPLYVIIDHVMFAKMVLERKRFPDYIIVRIVLSMTLMIYSYIRKLIEKIDLYRQVEVGEVSCFDNSFDSVWEKIEKENKKLIYVRDVRNLKWHFKYAIGKKKIWIVTCQEDGELMGYAIYLVSHSDTLGLRRCVLVDIQVVGCKFDSVVKALLKYGVKKCKKNKIHILESVGFEKRKRDVIKKILPWRRSYPDCPYYYKATDKVLGRELESQGNWDPSAIDGDAAL